MAKYSQYSSRLIRKKPHLFMLFSEWVYLPTTKTFQDFDGLNAKAGEFCDKLNNAAPKRGLKA